MFLNGGKLLCFDANTGTFSRIDRPAAKSFAGGPCRQTVAPDPNAAAQAGQRVVCGGGASFGGGRLMVWGPQAALLDSRTGEVLWSFEPWRVRKFPIRLPESDAPPQTSPSPVVSMTTPSYGGYGFGGYRRFYRPPYSPGGLGAAEVQCVDYAQLGKQAVLPPGDICLAGPAVAWAAETRQNPFGSAVLLGEKLLLFGEGGLRVLRTDLPLSAECANVNGTWLGMAGNTACLLGDNNLMLADFTAHGLEVRSFQSEGGFLQVILDGAVIYLTTPKGIQCIRAHDGQKVFDVVDWPAGAAAKAAKDALSAASPSDPNDPFGAPPPPAMNPYGGGNVANPQDQNWRQPAGLGCVERGVLYTVSLPGRVVAVGAGGKIMDADGELFDAEFLGRLRSLFFKLRKRRQLQRRGVHPTPAAGFTREYKDHRRYTPGDDFRAIDWRLFRGWKSRSSASSRRCRSFMSTSCSIAAARCWPRTRRSG